MGQPNRLFSAEYLQEVGRQLFEACGAPPDEAGIVAHELVEASLMGLDSHGVIRFIFYTDQALSGGIVPGAPVRVVKETHSTAIVDCGHNFGPVSARRMVDIVCEKAAANEIACAVSRNGHHVSRLGAYVQRAAEQGFFSLATANTSKMGHYVVPWGGKEPRLATNPVAYAVPTSGDPIVLDMSTSMIAEGKVKVLMHEGKTVPSGCIQDFDGNPTVDPKVFYGPPRGAILPFGSEYGYKGFGLGLLVEILGGILAGMDTPADQDYINGLCIIAINPDAFCGRQNFRLLIDNLCEYITSTKPAPGFDQVLLPGSLDFRMRRKRLAEGIPLAEQTWREILERAHRVGAAIDLMPEDKDSLVAATKRSRFSSHLEAT